MSKLDTWCESLKRLVQADGSRAATVILEGPDGSQWGSWSADIQDLAETIRQAMHLTCEELPTGNYQCKVTALDGNQAQLSSLVQTARGRSSAAMIAANEHRAMQQAVALAQANMEAQTVGLRTENERLRKLLDEYTDNHSTLLEQFLRIQSTNIDVELKLRESQERRELFAGLVKELTPLVQVGSALLAEWVEERIAERKAAKRLKSAPASPSDKSPPDRSPAPQSAKREGPVSDPGGPSLGVASPAGPGEASSPDPSRAQPADVAPPTRKDPPRRTNHASKKPVRPIARG